MNTNTIPKHSILNWLYSTDRQVSLDKLAVWLEENTRGQYKLVRVPEIFNDRMSLDKAISRSEPS
jgi:hypothetical protein